MCVCARNSPLISLAPILLGIHASRFDIVLNTSRIVHTSAWKPSLYVCIRVEVIIQVLLFYYHDMQEESCFGDGGGGEMEAGRLFCLVNAAIADCAFRAPSFLPRARLVCT